ncbi:hypothetical protein ACFX15_007918 [Malus domestica]
MSINHRGGEKSFAEDVAVDAEGNAYVTDCTASKIWKVGADGKLLSTIRSPLFRAKECPSGRLVESSDGWETASVVAKFSGTKHRLATAATMKTHESWTHRSSTTAIVFICRLDVVYGVFI